MFSPRPSRCRRSSGRQQPPAEDAGTAAGEEQGRPETQGSDNVQGLSLPSEIEATLDLPSPAPSNDDGSGVEVISRTPHNTPMSGVPSPNVQIPDDWSSIFEELLSEEYSTTPSVSPTPSPPPGWFNSESKNPAPRDYWTSDAEVESRDGNYQVTFETEKYHRFLNFTFGGCARLLTAISKEVRNPRFRVVVYGEGVQTGEEVVVKKPFSGYDRVEEFLQEIEAYKKIQGPCIVECKDSYQQDSVDHLVMEKMDTDLFKMLKRTPDFSEADRKSLMKMALTGLKVIHDQGYIHFDIKPDNLFFSQTKGLKIGDLGRAAQSYDEHNHNVLYFRNYRPPELFIETGPVNQKADIWAIGTIHQDLIMGRSMWTKSVNEPEQFSLIETLANSKCLRKTKEFDELNELEFSFLSSLMELSPEDRASVDEALAHPWFTADPAPTPSQEIPIKKISRRRGVQAKESGVKREREEETEGSLGREKRANTASPGTTQNTNKDSSQHSSHDDSQHESQKTSAYTRQHESQKTSAYTSQHESQKTSAHTSQHESQETSEHESKSQVSSQHQSTSSASSTSSKRSKGKRGREEDSLEDSDHHKDKKPTLGGDQQQEGATSDSDQDSIST